MDIKKHYDDHLGNFYSWMIGPFQDQQEKQQLFFRKNNITPHETGVALDLGAGSGIQSVSLAKLGFMVKAIDFNNQLLHELKINSHGLNIEVIDSDLNLYMQKFKGLADLVICMGDTLTHLDNIEQIEYLIVNITLHLANGGKVIFSFRDLTNELYDANRFIPVKSDVSRILTCFLEYLPTYVNVHDILYELLDGNWIQKVSAYKKLRLDTTTVTTLLKKHGISIQALDTERGMITIIGMKE